MSEPNAPSPGPPPVPGRIGSGIQGVAENFELPPSMLPQPKPSPFAWCSEAKLADVEALCDAVAAEIVDERVRSSTNPLGAIRSPEGIGDSLMLEWQTRVSQALKDKYGPDAWLWSPTAGGRHDEYELDEGSYQIFRDRRIQLARAVDAAGRRFAAEAEQARLVEAQATPGLPHVPGAFSPLLSPPATRLTAAQWLADQERQRQQNFEARNAAAQQRQQSRTARGRPPGGL